MNRRAFVATGVAGVATIATGYSVLAPSTVRLDEPTVSGDDDDLETERTYSRDGRTLAVLTVDQRLAQESTSDPFPLDFSLAHGDAIESEAPDTTIRRFRLGMRVPRGRGRPPGKIAIRPPGRESWPPVTYEVTDDGLTVLEAEGLTEETGGDGTLTIETRVNPLGAGVEHVDCRFEAVLATGSERLVIDDEWRVVPVVVPGSPVDGRPTSRGAGISG
jgi:hypothetical protein